MRADFSLVKKAGWVFPVLLAVSVAAHAGFFAARFAVAPDLAGEQIPVTESIEVVLVEEIPVSESEPEPSPPSEPEVEMPPEPLPTPEPVVETPPEPEATPAPTPEPTPAPIPAATPKPQTPKPKPPAAAKKPPAQQAARPAPQRMVKARPDVSRNQPPRYPESARRAKQEGRAMVRATVSADGRVQSVKIQRSSGHAILDRAALDAVRRWRFIPQQVNGQNSASEVDVPVNFFLTES